MMQHIAPDAVPEQFHRALVAIGLKHAGTAEFQQPLAAMGIEEAGEIILARGIEIDAAASATSERSRR